MLRDRLRSPQKLLGLFLPPPTVLFVLATPQPPALLLPRALILLQVGADKAAAQQARLLVRH